MYSAILGLLCSSCCKWNLIVFSSLYEKSFRPWCCFVTYDLLFLRNTNAIKSWSTNCCQKFFALFRVPQQKPSFPKYLEYELKPKIQGKPELKCKFFAWYYSSLKSLAQSPIRVTLNSLSIYCTPVPQHINVSFHRFIVLRLQYMSTREWIRDEALAQSLSLF